MDVDDFYQAGMIGLWKAIKTYNNDEIDRGKRFRTYALECIKTEIKNEIRTTAFVTAYGVDHGKTVELSYDDLFKIPSDRSVYDTIESEDLLYKIFLKKLNQHQGEICFDAHINGMKFKDIAQKHKVSAARISEVIKTCSVKLRGDPDFTG